MSRGDAMRDVEAARSVRPGRDRQVDQPPIYAPSEVDHRLSMDPGRFDVDGCWPVLTSQRLIGSSVQRWRVECRNCHLTWRGDTEAEAMGKARRAHGE